MSVLSPWSQRTWKRNSSPAQHLDRCPGGCVCPEAKPGLEGLLAPAWRQARSTGVTGGPRRIHGEDLPSGHPVPASPCPVSHPVTEGAFESQDQTRHLPAASTDPGITFTFVHWLTQHKAAGNRSRAFHNSAFHIFLHFSLA